MEIKKTKHNFEDERGYIHDIFTHMPVEAGTLISFKTGVARGNHYHNFTYQYDYILEGRLLCVTEDENGTREEVEVVEGDFITHPPKQRHAYKAIEPSRMISFTVGPRQGDDYERDVIRLEKPLIK